MLLPFDLPSVRRKKLTIDFAGGNQSSDGGLLLLREAERKLGVCRRLAEAMPDRRDPDRVWHAMFEMVMARASAIACGYEDAIDLDRLRHDPLMKVAVGRCPESGAPLASQSTISRLENAPSKTEAARLSAALLDQFGTSVKPGKLAVLDIDDTFCAAHGGQQLAFWNAHHDECGFASMHIYHVASGTPVAAILRPARTPQGQRGAHRHQACDQAPAPPLAEDPHRVARRQPLRPGRGDGMGRRPRCRLHIRPRRQCRARRAGGGGRCQSALPSCDEQRAEAAHLCELPVPSRELEAAAQGRGSAGMLAAAGRGRHAVFGFFACAGLPDQPSQAQALHDDGEYRNRVGCGEQGGPVGVGAVRERERDRDPAAHSSPGQSRNGASHEAGQRPRHGDRTRRIAPAAETNSRGYAYFRPCASTVQRPLRGAAGGIGCNERAFFRLTSASIASRSHMRAMSIRMA